MKTKRIIFVISSLGGGGAERVISNMANDWAEKGHDITIVTFSGANEPIFYTLHPAIKTHPLDVSGKTTNAVFDNINRIKKLRGVFKQNKSDIIISFMETTNILTILASRGLKITVIVSDRIDPSLHSYGRVWRLLRNITYIWANKLVLQTKGTCDNYPTSLVSKSYIIPNPVKEQIDKKTNIQEKITKNIIICSMGRLAYQKGFDILIRAFSKVIKTCPHVTLQIWGEGSEHHNLKDICKRLGVIENVGFMGLSNNTYNTLSQSDIFVLSSRYEGFPNVLLEAMACGLPVISTNCLCGPSEIITHGEDGILIPVGYVDALANAMEKLIQDEPERERLAQNAQKNVSRFYIDNIMKKWESLIQNLLETEKIK